MTAKKSLTINVQRWSNQHQRFQRAGIYTKKDGISTFQYDSSAQVAIGPDLPSTTNPIQLSTFSTSDLFPTFNEAVPSGFAAKIIGIRFPEWKPLTPAEKLVSMVIRETETLRLAARDIKNASIPIIGITAVESIMQHIRNCKTTDDIVRILNSENFSGLTAVNGVLPKCHAILNNTHVIAKMPAQRNSCANIEHCMNVMMKAAGCNTVKSTVHNTKHGQTLIISKRFDIVQTGDQEIRHHKTTLAGAAEATGSRISHLTDAFKLLNKLSTNPEKDSKELARRLMFFSICKNTDCHLRNFELIQTKNNKYQLSPSFDVNIDTSSLGRFKVPLAPGIKTSKEADNLPLLIDTIIENSTLSSSDVRKISLEVLETFLNFDHYLKLAGVSTLDAKYIQKNIALREDIERLIKKIQTQSMEQDSEPRFN